MLVGKEEFCDFQTIQTAIDFVEAEMDSNKHIELSILEGTYFEQITIRRSHISLTGIGDVVISHNAHAKQLDEQQNEIGTFATATLYLDGTDVHLNNLTIENTAGHGEIMGQAIALYANCDLSTFINCQIKGYQDTLFNSNLPDKQKDGTNFLDNRAVHKHYRQYYYNCTIEGTVDYIFGGATAYFDRCLLINKARLNNEPGYITAANTPKNQHYGFIFNECFVKSEENTEDVYLGRPWRPYAKVRFQDCKMTNAIQKERWHDWNDYNNRYTAKFEEVRTEQTKFSNKYSGIWSITDDQLDQERLKPEEVFQGKFCLKKGMMT